MISSFLNNETWIVYFVHSHEQIPWRGFHKKGTLRNELSNSQFLCFTFHKIWNHSKTILKSIHICPPCKSFYFQDWTSDLRRAGTMYLDHHCISVHQGEPHILGAQLKGEAEWVLNFPHHVTVPAWTLCSPTTSRGCSHALSWRCWQVSSFYKYLAERKI